jgi:ferredoxin
LKALVDKDTCIGCGLCPAICPEVFDMDDDGKAVATSEEIGEASRASALEAEESCPVNAISVEQ